jgi:hypothetical protein
MQNIQPVRLAGGWCWFVLRENYCWLVAGGWFVLREKYCWLVADKPNEQKTLHHPEKLQIRIVIGIYDRLEMGGEGSPAFVQQGMWSEEQKNPSPQPVSPSFAHHC